MKLTVTHTLTLSLGAPLRAVEHVLLTPVDTPQQRVEHWSIGMPGIAEAPAFRDGYGNVAQLVSQIRPGDSLEVRATGIVETTDRAGVLGRLPHEPPPAVFLRVTPLTTADERLLTGLDMSGGRIAVLHELMGRAFDHAGPAQSQVQDDDTRQQSQADSDAAHLVHAFIGAARALDIPARFVNGYLFDEGEASLHAWAEAWDAGLGWIAFDPLLNLCPTDTHLRLATALDATGTTPLRTVPAPLFPIEQALEIVAG